MRTLSVALLIVSGLLFGCTSAPRCVKTASLTDLTYKQDLYDCQKDARFATAARYPAPRGTSTATGWAAMNEFGVALESRGFYDKIVDQCMEAKGYTKKGE